ncbi:DUF5659 domain-containing protein [Bacillus thuringiensis]|uniref:DUF5659 domain-containing protein n=1 Tax=Bacillus thuringiensis TaxID=1428 RepID=UPI000BF9FF6C|nr:DUF5659 domain-containing protein [Bacillus thuringiensis]PEV51784.1 hypothetical protein CN421_02220 [Bacillus thuringiensis]PFW42778.1 hypothetical protein COL28_15020 [Bacillus thuringiensis]PGL22297.1 hypothetical protein CN921_20920 [Bacillus thuringiensis]
MKYTTETKGKHVFSVGMANYLLQRGHKLLAIKENKRIKQASVFLYEKTPALFQDMERYKQLKEQECYIN